jgi:DNA-binding NarL/FixJ family response regulator
VALLWSRGVDSPPEDVAARVLAGGTAAVPPFRWPAPAGSDITAPPLPGLAGPRYGGLTSREQEIAALLTRGLSNRVIALELVISPATVAKHVANIMEKLGFTSRAQIAVWAAAHGLDAEEKAAREADIERA